MNVRFPEMRLQIKAAVDELADPGRQQRVWLSDVPAARFGDVIHWLYDDSPGLFEDPHKTVGVYLVSDQEAAVIASLFRSLEAMFSKMGLDRSDAEYMESDHWPQVVRSAAAAKEVMDSFG